MYENKELNMDLNPEDTALIGAIVKRARRLKLCGDSLGEEYTTTHLTVTHLNGCPLDLPALLNFQDDDFTHDILEIRYHINTDTGKLKDFFDPRCSLPE
jgi:hypothetical protein